MKGRNTKQLLYFPFSELETPGRIRLNFAETEPGRIVVIKFETTRIQVLSDEVFAAVAVVVAIDSRSNEIEL